MRGAMMNRRRRRVSSSPCYSLNSRRKPAFCSRLVVLSLSLFFCLQSEIHWNDQEHDGSNEAPVGQPSFGFLLGAEAKKESETVRFPLPLVPYDRTTKNSDSEDYIVNSLLPKLDAFIQDATSYLIRISHTHEQDSVFPGRFTYEADLRTSLNPTLRKNYWTNKDNYQLDYNLLRHNGAVYALSQAYLRNRERLAEKKETMDPTSKREMEDRQLEILTTMDRAIGYLRDNALLPVPNRKEELLAAWERTNLDDPHSEPETAKLGGAGLAMIALGRLETIRPNSVSIEGELRKLGAFVESLQNPHDGSFTCKYEWRTGPTNEWVSLYYPGEAALGLVTLAELELDREGAGKPGMVTSTELELEHQQRQHHHHDSQTNGSKESQRWIRVATKALLYLEQYRRNQDLEDIEPDHWALLATARLLPILNQQRQGLNERSRERKQADLEYWLVYNHGVRVATSMVADHTTKGLKENDGCFTYDSRTCPTSTRLEGLLAAMTFIHESELFLGSYSDEDTDGKKDNYQGDATELLLDRIEHDVGLGIQFLLKAQEKSNRNGMRGAVPGKFTGKKPSLPKKRDQNQQHQASNDDEEDSGDEDEDYEISAVRVDYVQHSMSAIMAYEAFLMNNTKQKQKGFHQVVNEKVHKVADPIIHHVRKKIGTATRSSTFVNYALLGGVICFVFAMVVLAYCPMLFTWPCSKRYRHKRRRIKRKD